MRGVPAVVAAIAAHDPDEVFISSVTAYELYTGVEKCSNAVRERTAVENLLNTLRPVEFDLPAARDAARIRAELESRGERIGAYDLLLAGQAISLGYTLVTNNTREFSRVAMLTIEDWRAVVS